MLAGGIQARGERRPGFHADADGGCRTRLATVCDQYQALMVAEVCRERSQGDVPLQGCMEVSAFRVVLDGSRISRSGSWSRHAGLSG